MAKKNKFTRREFLEIGGLGTVGLMLAQNVKSQPKQNAKEMLLYIGTYTSTGKSQGIYVHKFDLTTGKLTPLHIVKDVLEPSFLVIGKDRKCLYAVNELLEYEGKKSGAVSAFAIDQKTGNLTFLNKQPSLGSAPCFISVSENGKFALVANYLGGNVAVFPIEKDGKLGASVDLVQHTGFGPNKGRQEAAHAHSIKLFIPNRFACAADLGTDKVMIYQFDDKTGNLKPNAAQPFYQAGSKVFLLHVLYHLAGHFRASEVVKWQFMRQQERSLRLKKLFDHINARSAEKLSVNAAARLVGMSASQFMKAFKQVAGMTLVAYLNHARLANGARLLRETDRSIAEIADATGFSDQSYFDKRFKKSFGQSPREFRARRIGADENRPKKKA